MYYFSNIQRHLVLQKDSNKLLIIPNHRGLHRFGPVERPSLFLHSVSCGRLESCVSCTQCKFSIAILQLNLTITNGPQNPRQDELMFTKPLLKRKKGYVVPYTINSYIPVSVPNQRLVKILKKMTPKLMKKKHAKYFHIILQMMPNECPDAMRMTFAYFAISGLDLLDAMADYTPEEKQNAIAWIYRLQLTGAGPRSGFQSSTMIPNDIVTEYHCGHLAMTYTGLASLLILGDDLSRVDKKSIIEGVRACQNPDGSFTAMVAGYESDMRFVYCACCVSAMLDDWSGVNKAKAIDYIVKSISYDGAIGQGPGLESHGGSTFCAVASLFLMNELNNVLSEKQLERLKRWCLMRQDGGFNGRPGKTSDSCYSFWIGATLQILGVGELSDCEENRAFVLDTQNTIMGGFGKYDNVHTDPLHAYLGLCGLSVIRESSLQEINPALNISQRAYAHLQKIHERWRNK